MTQSFLKIALLAALASMGVVVAMEGEKRKPRASSSWLSPFETFFDVMGPGEEVAVQEEETPEELTRAEQIKKFFEEMVSDEESVDFRAAETKFIEAIKAHEDALVEDILTNYREFLDDTALLTALHIAEGQDNFNLMRRILHYKKLDLFEIIRDYPKFAKLLLTEYYYGETKYTPEDIRNALLQTIITDDRENLALYILDTFALAKTDLIEAIAESFVHQRFELAKTMLNKTHLSQQDLTTLFNTILESIVRSPDFKKIYQVLEDEVLTLIKQDDYQKAIENAIHMAVLQGRNEALQFLLEIANRHGIEIDTQSLVSILNPYVSTFITLRGAQQAETQRRSSLHPSVSREFDIFQSST